MNKSAILLGLLDWSIRKRSNAMARVMCRLFKSTTSTLGILPAMSAQEYAFLHSLMRLHRDSTYIEYGSGGSTLLADRYFNRIIAFETDVRWCNRINAQLHHGRVQHVDVGETGDFGNPREMTAEKASRIAGCYQGQAQQGRTSSKLFVLIDGRCRVLTSCFVFQYVKDGDIVLLHDFINRREYYDILQMYDLCYVCGTLALLKPTNSYAGRLAATSLAAAYQSDFR
jgi:hypothetical protein